VKLVEGKKLQVEGVVLASKDKAGQVTVKETRRPPGAQGSRDRRRRPFHHRHPYLRQRSHRGIRAESLDPDRFVLGEAFRDHYRCPKVSSDLNVYP